MVPHGIRADGAASEASGRYRTDAGSVSRTASSQGRRIRVDFMRRDICALAAIFTLACAAEPASTNWEVQRQVAGDTTTVHTVAGQIWPSEVWLSEDLAIGVLDGPVHLIFGEITRMAEDLRGGIYVLDGQVPEIRHFDRTGNFVGTVGRAGAGPGEYGPLTLGMVVDSAGVLYVHDWANSPRIVRFAEDGRALDPWTLDSPFLTTAPGTWLYSDAPGRSLITTRSDNDAALLVLEDGQVKDTLPLPRLPGMPKERGGPYRIETYWSWHPDGYFVVGVSNEYSFDERRPDGVLRIRRDVEKLPVHPEEADAYRRLFEWMEQQPAYRPPEGEWIPSTMPPFRGIEVGTDGRIWVRRNTHPIRIPVVEPSDGRPAIGWTQPFVYDVFEADGSFLGEIRFPELFEPYLFGTGHVWGVRRGEFDEEYVVRLSIRAGD